MPSEISWYQHRRVIAHSVQGKVTLEDVARMARDQSRYLHEGVFPVHTIFDVTYVEKFPTDLRALKTALSGVDYPNLGWIIVVGMRTSVQRFVTTVIAKIVVPGAKLRTLNTIAEVPQFLYHVDATLQPTLGTQTPEPPVSG